MQNTTDKHTHAGTEEFQAKLTKQLKLQLTYYPYDKP